MNAISCSYCGITTHIEAVEVGTLKESTSGKSLVVRYECENGHRYEVRTVDHSGGTWPSIHTLEPIDNCGCGK